MKIPARVWIPVTAAVLVAGALLFVLWWKLSDTAAKLKTEITSMIDLPSFQTELIDAVTPVDTGDRALLHLRKGDLLALRGEWNAAQAEYETAVEAGGGIGALRKLASAQLQRRDIPAVRTTIRRLKQEGARVEDLTLLESIVHMRTGELVKARELLEASEESPQKHYGLGLLAIIQGMHEQAKVELAQTIAGWDPVLRSYARSLQAAYDEFALFPESQELHLVTLLSRGLAQVQECELALPLLVQVLEQQDDYRDAWIVQGYCELVTERYEQSLASLERAYAIDPEKSEVQYFLARAYAALKDHQNAITFFSYALQNGFKPEKEVRHWIAREATEIGNTDLALEQYQAIANAQDSAFEETQEYVDLLLALGKKEEAYATSLKAASKWPDDARAHLLHGKIALETDRKPEAKASFEKALQIDPELSEAKELLKEAQ